MNEQTEKLKKALMGIWDEGCPRSITEDITNQILKACKEAGLVFKVGEELLLDDMGGLCLAEVNALNMLCEAGFKATLEIDV